MYAGAVFTSPPPSVGFSFGAAPIFAATAAIPPLPAVQSLSEAKVSEAQKLDQPSVSEGTQAQAEVRVPLDPLPTDRSIRLGPVPANTLDFDYTEVQVRDESNHSRKILVYSLAALVAAIGITFLVLGARVNVRNPLGSKIIGAILLTTGVGMAGAMGCYIHKQKKKKIE